MAKIGTYIKTGGDYVSVPADGSEHLIATIKLNPGTWVVSANINCWVTEGTTIYTRLSDSGGAERHYASGGENNIVTTVILQSDIEFTVTINASHADTNGARTFIANSIKAVRIM